MSRGGPLLPPGYSLRKSGTITAYDRHPLGLYLSDGSGLFRQLAAAEKPIRNDECAVGAVCDRPQCRNEDIAGAHRAPLQFAYIFVPEFRFGLDEVRHHLNAGRIFKYDDGDSVRPE